jgi:hypothetical protein
MSDSASLARRTLTSCILAAGLAGTAAAQTTLLEVENNSGEKLLQVTDDGALLALGTSGTSLIPAEGEGARFMWYPGKAALRSGAVNADQWDDQNIGTWSFAAGFAPWAAGQASVALGSGAMATGPAAVALGENSAANGRAAISAGLQSVAGADASVALGFETSASGLAAIALGQRATASANAAIAMGGATTASGAASLATGRNTVASGNVATALGAETSASGEFATALGHNASATMRGSFVFGDASSNNVVTTPAQNTFIARAAGGFRFLTDPNLITGCDIGNGNLVCTGTVSGSSSVTLKHDFEPLDAEAVLEKVAGLDVQRWRYLADTADVRHVGPTAEDFHAAFGLGANDRTIAMVDADGINLLASQALARRTAKLRDEVTALRAELHTLLSLMGKAE